MERRTELDHAAASRLRVILVAYHYPPDSAVGSLRARNVAHALANAGHEVHVVSVEMSNAPADSRDGLVHVVRVPLAASPRDLLARAKRMVTRNGRARREPNQSASTADVSGATWKVPTRVSILKRWLGAITWLPDDRQGFILPAARAATRLMRNDGTDMLYTTAPPFSDHIVGLLVRRRRNCRWVVDFRDPWTDNTYKPWFVRSRLTDRLDHWAEKRCLHLADGEVTVTEAYADVLRGRYGKRMADKLIVVLNGVPRVMPAKPSNPLSFRIVYAGSFYLGRDPHHFFRALAKLQERGTMPPKRLEVQLVGDCRYFEGEDLAPTIRRLGLSDVVTFVDWLPHAQMAELMQSADILLLLAQNQPLSVPNKLYEYLGVGKPILAIADDVGDTVRLLRQIGGHFVVGEGGGPDAIADALARAREASTEDRTQSEMLDLISTDAQMKLLTTWIDKSRDGRLSPSDPHP
jgi:glycosyltransferase involved in cell wall biosynthesis